MRSRVVETGYSTWTVSTVADFGRYTITSQQSGFDGFLFIYQSPFDPSDPLSNCLAANDDEEGGRQSIKNRRLVVVSRY